MYNVKINELFVLLFKESYYYEEYDSNNMNEE